MTGIEYLNQLKIMNIIVKQKEKEKEEIENKIYNISAVNFKNERVKSSHNKDTYSLIDKYIDDKSYMEKIIARNTDNKNHIIGQIQKLYNSKYIDILYKRYVEFKCFNIIANEMGYSNSHIIREHSKAIKNFECRFNSEFENMIVNDIK